jgi:hypothetical protein
LNKERWAIVAIVCIALVGIVLLARKTEPASTLPKAGEAMALASVARTPPEAATAPAQAPSTPERMLRHGDEEIEVCGAGFQPIDDAALRFPTFPLPGPALVARVSDALKAGSSPPARALGIWLTSIDASRRAAAPLQAQIELCAEQKSCVDPLRERAWSAGRDAAREGLDALARDAADSADPAVYAMALQACGSFGPDHASEGNCQLINLQRWAQIDPDNVVPWTDLVSDAMARNQPDAASEALYRASVAGTSRMYGDTLLAIAEPALASGLTPTERRQMAWQILGLQAVWQLPSYATPVKMCSGDALQDSNRRQVCDAYAQTLIDKGNTLIERALGTRIGERLQWPGDRLDTLFKERDAMSLAQHEEGADSLSCAALERSIDRSMRDAGLGEIARARAAIAASGRSTEEWAALVRQRRQAAATPTAAPSAASGA